jgi:PAS domain S-box-containing protein
MEVVASLCDAAIQIGQQKAGAADLQASLARVEAEMQAPFEASSEAFLLVDDDFGIVRANPAACRLLGYLPGEIEGLPVRDVLVGPEDLTGTLLEARGHDREAQRARITLHRRDGTPFPAQLRAAPLHSAGQARLLLVVSDLSERQAIEDRTETLAQRALLGEVTAIFAHEVRDQPCTGVQQWPTPGQRSPLRGARAGPKECLRLNQLMGTLAFARPLELKIEPLISPTSPAPHLPLSLVPTGRGGLSHIPRRYPQAAADHGRWNRSSSTSSPTPCRPCRIGHPICGLSPAHRPRPDGRLKIADTGPAFRRE